VRENVTVTVSVTPFYYQLRQIRLVVLFGTLKKEKEVDRCFSQ
jgi:hypothetical protein